MLRLDKWYLDCRAGDAFGYYYVTRLRVGPLGLGSSEIHHGDLNVRRTRPWAGRTSRPASRSLRAAGASLEARSHRIDACLPTSRGALRGTWSSSSAPPRRPGGLLYRDAYGWCDWKVWAPRANVELELPTHDDAPLRGKGYADYVRLEFDPWRMPIRSIHWGHLGAGTRSLVLFRMHIGERHIAWMHTDGGWLGAVDVRTRRDAAGLRAFEWCLGTRRVLAESVRLLERGPILSTERLGRWLPPRLRRALGSGGFEEKHWVEADLGGLRLEGPMEEVRFDAV